MKVTGYNFLFHPLQESHSTNTKVLSVVTNIALTALSCGAYLLVFSGIHMSEWCCQKKIAPQPEEIPVSRPESSRPVPAGLIDSQCFPMRFRDPGAVHIQLNRSPNVPVRLTNSLPPRLQAIKEKQADHLRKLQGLAKVWQWGSLQKHSTHRDSSFDWWMFPIDRGSEGQGDTYRVNPAEVALLKKDPVFLKNYRDGVILVAKSWGWDLERGKDVTNGAQKWTGYNVRLGKMLDSLRLFGQDDLRRNLIYFISKYHIRPTLDPWIQSLL